MGISLLQGKNVFETKRLLLIRTAKDDIADAAAAVQSSTIKSLILPDLCLGFKAMVWGGGGGGSTYYTTHYSEGGGGGGYSEGVYALTAGSKLDLTIGYGGWGGLQDFASYNNNPASTQNNGTIQGSNGSASIISYNSNVLLQATGGIAGNGSVNASGIGGVGSGGQINFVGGSGGKNLSNGATSNAAGGGSAAGPWGNGFNGANGAGGGGGIGGNGGAGVGGIGGGGGSFSAAITNTPGTGFYTNTAAPYYGDSAVIDFSSIFQFFDPKYMGGAANLLSSGNTGYGANGAGGSGATDNDGAAGGIFGGGGGAGNGFYGGPGGIAAGGGGSFIGSSAGEVPAARIPKNNGGNGMIILDLYFGI